jgi:3'(2'), 5'-bisphosphate nucleotidase
MRPPLGRIARLRTTAYPRSMATACAAELRAALAAAREAARLTEAVRASLRPGTVAKDDRSPVTVADYGAQALICRSLARAFPHDPVVGEEHGRALREPGGQAMLARVVEEVAAIVPDATAADVLAWIDHGDGAPAGRWWTLDPVDGTRGFLRGDQYAIAVALIEGGTVRVGVLACPALSLVGAGGTLFGAVAGQGAFMEPLAGGPRRPLAVVQPGDTAHLRFAESVEAGHGDQQRQAAIARAAGITAPPLRMDSQAKYGIVAAGEAALYLRLPNPDTPAYREKAWDHAAGALLVAEAGGRVTDAHGRSLDFAAGATLARNQGIVASNGAIHDAVLGALAG